MKILLSPAKSIQTNLSYPHTDNSRALFLGESEKLIKKLKKYSIKNLAELFHVSLDIAALNFTRFQNWESPTEIKDETIPCIFAFTGEVYRGLNSRNLNENELVYLNENLRILSGLYGVLKPFDLMYPYRLEMGTRIEITPKIKNLYQFWGDKITDKLNSEENEIIINLASNEYFKVLNTKKIKAKIITPIFKEFKNGEYKIVMTYAKNARGEMTKYCAQHAIINHQDIKLFDLSNYKFDDKFSTENEYVFVR